jgi:hypothetical protein
MVSASALVAATLLLLYMGSIFNTYLTTFLQARRFAKSSPLPYVSVYSPRGKILSMLFWIFSPVIAPFFEALPFRLGHWIRYAKKDFAWASKGELHRKDLKSDVWWNVGASGLVMWISDADVITQITHRWKDFPKPPYVSLSVFGQNVVTSEGVDWQRHKKITGPPFNDRNNR